MCAYALFTLAFAMQKKSKTENRSVITVLNLFLGSILYFKKKT